MFIFNLFIEEVKLDVDIVEDKRGKIFGELCGWEYFFILTHIQFIDKNGCNFSHIAFEIDDKFNFLLTSEKLLDPVSSHFWDLSSDVLFLVGVHLTETFGSV